MKSADGKNYLDTPALPVEAVREALANAFIHCDYKAPGKTLVISSEKSSGKSSEKILHHLRGEPALSAKALAEKLGISSRAVEKQINLLKKEGSLARIGPAKGDHWQVRS